MSVRGWLRWKKLHGAGEEENLLIQAEFLEFYFADSFKLRNFIQ
jgi:hypothetical protein